MLDLSEALRSLGWSDRKAGEAILYRWRQLERRDRYPAPASIATKLGLLKRGDVTWWRQHRHALEALAAMLSCPVEELLPDGEASRPSSITCEEFPQLSPLLPGQEPCSLHNDFLWLGSMVESLLQQGKHAWVIAPHGAGKSLAIRVLRQRHSDSLVAMTARRLVEAMRLARDGLPLLIEIEESDPLIDAVVLTELAQRPGVCVLAPFAPPGWPDMHPWTVARWEPGPGWRKRLVQWARARLPESRRLDHRDIMRWLERHDPQERLFQTPGHLLTLLERTYRAGELPREPAPLLGLTRETLHGLVARSHDIWLDQVGVSAIEKMLTARLLRLELPLGPLTAEEWASLVPTDRLPATARSESPRRRPHAPSATPPWQAVHLLTQAHILQSHAGGRLDVAPWIQAACERETIKREVHSGSTRWALWAVENSRKDAVDDALDALSPTALLKASSQALEAERQSLETVAAIEALFAAIGRRFLREDWRPTTEQTAILQRLARRQLRHVSRLPKVGTVMPWLPLTRQRPGFQERWTRAWLAEAWAFSFAVERPDKKLDDPGWWLPGWSRQLRLSRVPEALGTWSTGTARERSELERFLPVARQVVKSCQDETLPDEVPVLLLPWIIVDGPGRGWRLPPSSYHQLLHEQEVNAFVARQLDREPREVQEQALTAVWQAALASQRTPGRVLNELRHHAPALFDPMVDRLPLAVFVASLTPDVLRDGLANDWLEQLPSRFLQAALPGLVGVMGNRSPLTHRLVPLVERIDEEALDLLVALTIDPYALGVAAARRVWRLAPGRAQEEARQALLRTGDTSYLWFHATPPTFHEAMLTMLEETSQPVAWAARWLVEILPLAGATAPRVFEQLMSSRPE
ncbi:MAG: hypothetical protein EOO70_01155 [Myxococcaceae bacterium]|nr:MAG: hypothetical protein EOO70_01155 [Myxococcaceae bacterium]